MADFNFCPNCGHDLIQYKVKNNNNSSEDELYPEVISFVITAQSASASLLQRRFKVGYSRAARFMDLLEEDDTVSPADGAKPRTVMFKDMNEYAYSLAIGVVVRSEHVSVESLAATLAISKSEAGKILERMKYEGVIGDADEEGIHLVLRKEE